MFSRSEPSYGEGRRSVTHPAVNSISLGKLLIRDGFSQGLTGGDDAV
jgi:hypothetical protein